MFAWFYFEQKGQNCTFIALYIIWTGLINGLYLHIESISDHMFRWSVEYYFFAFEWFLPNLSDSPKINTLTIQRILLTLDSNQITFIIESPIFFLHFIEFKFSKGWCIEWLTSRIRIQINWWLFNSFFTFTLPIITMQFVVP